MTDAAQLIEGIQVTPLPSALAIPT